MGVSSGTFPGEHLTITMVTRMMLTMVLAVTMGNAMPREGRWGENREHVDADWDKKYEEPEYTVEREERSYEKRVCPPSIWDCTEIMQSQRYKTRVPASLMFWPLFRYISGNNAGEVKIEMTKGVTTSLSLIKRDRVWGDLEMQEMCFYLESKFQAEGTESVPEPLDPAVYIVRRPTLPVFVRKFTGSAFTSAVWQAQRDILEQDLTNKETFNSTLYYTVMKSHPWNPPHQRINEVWFPEADIEN